MNLAPSVAQWHANTAGFSKKTAERFVQNVVKGNQPMTDKPFDPNLYVPRATADKLAEALEICRLRLFNNNVLEPPEIDEALTEYRKDAE